MNLILALTGSILFVSIVVFGASSIVLYSRLRAVGLCPRFAMLSVPFYLTALCNRVAAERASELGITPRLVKVSQSVLLASGFAFVVLLFAQHDA
jgi:hypothetical protein